MPDEIDMTPTLQRATPQVIGDDLIEVDFAREFQEAIASSNPLRFQDEALRTKVLGTDANQLIVVTSTINSPKIVKGVEFYDQEFLLNSL